MSKLYGPGSSQEQPQPGSAVGLVDMESQEVCGRRQSLEQDVRACLYKIGRLTSLRAKHTVRNAGLPDGLICLVMQVYIAKVYNLQCLSARVHVTV